ncbi:MAG: hypothetical protein PHG19_02380 [Anaerotignum sp.]|nr:hypothetical protein [Anaerotignum sp.]
MSRLRYLTIPLDEAATEDYYNGVENHVNTIEWSISENEFEQLQESRVFEIINSHCNLMIDDFESEIIERQSMEKALECIKETYRQNPNSALEILLSYTEKALKHKTIMAFDF